MKQVTDAEIARTFKVSTDTIFRWRKDEIKYPSRYNMYKMFATLIKNDMNMYDVLSMSEKIKELEDAINTFVDKEEQLRDIRK